MKIPKKLRILGYDWEVKLVKEPGGSFYGSKKLIKLQKGSSEIESILLHEIMELLLMHLGFRFYGHEQGMEYRFLFNHTGLVQFHQLLYQTLKDNNLI